MRRRGWLLASFTVLFMACGGHASTLRQLGEPRGTAIDFQVENRTDAVINNLYLARSADVRAAPRPAFDPGTAEQQQLWGEDLLVGSGLEAGGRMPLRIAAPGRYDIRIVDRDGREQHIAGLQIRAGGRYVLELNDGGWRAAR
jgi:predicted  nucleic acid-binding Zn-ribbon protein